MDRVLRDNLVSVLIYRRTEAQHEEELVLTQSLYVTNPLHWVLKVKEANPAGAGLTSLAREGREEVLSCPELQWVTNSTHLTLPNETVYRVRS